MKILVDAHEGFREQVTGIGMYARNLVAQLSRLKSPHQITYLLMNGQRVDPAIFEENSVRSLWSLQNRTFWSQVRIPIHLLTYSCILFHTMDHKLPLLSRNRNVVTIYDLAFFKYPETVNKLHLMRYKQFTADAIRRADRIIAISQSTKCDLMEMFDIRQDAIDVTPLAPDARLFHPGVLPEGRKEKYILAVGTLQPRKNYPMLIRAFNRVCSQAGEVLELLIVGRQGWMWDDIIREAEKSAWRARIQFLGYLPDKQIARLYAGAEAFVMPSLYEGFGIPPLEAMSCGVPVITSNSSSFPEVVGDAGVMLDPNDETLWADTILKILGDRELRNELKGRGLAKAAQFSWQRTALTTMQTYQKTAGI